jgi:large conductance mechanosensitive channel
MFVKFVNKLRAKKAEPAPAPAPARKCPYCMGEIDEKATRCPHCTSQLN